MFLSPEKVALGIACAVLGTIFGSFVLDTLVDWIISVAISDPEREQERNNEILAEYYGYEKAPPSE